jgi:hypothetical protein
VRTLTSAIRTPVPRTAPEQDQLSTIRRAGRSIARHELAVPRCKYETSTANALADLESPALRTPHRSNGDTPGPRNHTKLGQIKDDEPTVHHRRTGLDRTIPPELRRTSRRGSRAIAPPAPAARHQLPIARPPRCAPATRHHPNSARPANPNPAPPTPQP